MIYVKSIQYLQYYVRIESRPKDGASKTLVVSKKTVRGRRVEEEEQSRIVEMK